MVSHIEVDENAEVDYRQLIWRIGQYEVIPLFGPRIAASMYIYLILNVPIITNG